ncbi:MAG: DivIVA domain-containing protein [Oscillospiraceae bacterium]|nr:DivIVA domain-containing protein [Oscillospiraceae bacterium]
MITSQDIRAKAFEKAVFGGYEMGSVDEYLEQVAQELDAQGKEIAVLKGKMKILADKVEEYRGTESAMRQALVSAQQLATQIETDARAKADAIVTDATAQSVEVLSDIKKQIAAEETRLAAVRASYAKFLSDAKGLCERQIRYLESVPKAKDVPAEPVQAAAPAAPAAMAADQTRITEPAQGNGDFGSTQMFSL